MGVAATLTKAFCFIGIILLGIALRRIGFFREEDFPLLSKIVLKITLPAAIAANLANKEIDPGMLSLCLLGFLGGVLYILLAFLLNAKNSREKRAFAVMNLPSYNIGNFTLPFVQSFLGPTGVIVTSLFDAGNAVIGLGGSYSIADLVLNGGGHFSPKKILKKLFCSLPFDVYLLMTLLSFSHIHVPAALCDFASLIGSGNAFLAMLMIGVGFHISGGGEKTALLIRLIVVRYAVALLLSLGFYFLLPFAREVRQTLCILAFAPIGSTAPAFSSELKLDPGLSSAINSISMLCSILCIVCALLLVL